MVNKIGIIKEGSIDEIVVNVEEPQLIFGLNNAHAQKKERKSIGHALVKTGLGVYATDTKWPNDSYVSNNRLYLPERYFDSLAHGGNYIFGDGFILVSDVIKDDLEKKLKDLKHFKRFFSGSKVIFVPPYSGEIAGIEGSKLRPEHIDLTIGYVPNRKVLSIGNNHYHQEEKLFEELRKEFGVSINRTNHDSFFPNNFFVVQYGGNVTVIANRYNNPLRKGGNEFKVIETKEEIINLPGKFGGSVKCAVNISPTTELWDKLGIKYERWGVNPKQINYAMH